MTRTTNPKQNINGNVSAATQVRDAQINAELYERGVVDERGIAVGVKVVDPTTGEIIERDALSTDERQQLDLAEQIIDKGIKVFVEVGNALLLIRDNRLYRQQYATFESYCEQRWGLKRQRAYELMQAAAVVGTLSEISDNPPQIESHAAPLSPLQPEEQKLVWQVVTETAPKGKVTAAHVKSVVKVLKDVTTLGAIDNGEGEDIPPKEATLDHLKAAVTEETYERMKRQEAYVAEKLERADYKRDTKSSRAADEYVPQGHDLCQTPPYAIDPLLPYLNTDWTVWEPAAGEGLLVEALFDSGFGEVAATDIQTGKNFFEFEPPHFDAIITNPPFSLKYRWLERCYELGKPFALLLPVEALGAKTAQQLMQKHGFEIMLLDQRVDFKMPNKGWEGAGSQFPVLWLCWDILPERVMFGSIEAGKREFKGTSDVDSE